MKYILLITLLCINLFSKDIESTKLEMKQDKVLVKINEHEIKQSHVDSFVSTQLSKSTFHRKVSNDRKKRLNKDALKSLIENELLYQYGKDKNLKIDKQVIEDEKKKLFSVFTSKEQLNNTLKANNTSVAEIERSIESDKMVILVVDKFIRKDFSDVELEEYYNNNKYKFMLPKSKKVQIIKVSINPTIKDPIKTAKAKIEEAKQKILEGKLFDEIAKTHSDDLSRIFGGDLGFIHDGQRPIVDKASENLQVGELSKIYKADLGFYLVKITDEKEEQQLLFKHVKEKLKKDLIETRQKETIANILKTQKEKSKITKF